MCVYKLRQDVDRMSEVYATTEEISEIKICYTKNMINSTRVALNKLNSFECNRQDLQEYFLFQPKAMSFAHTRLGTQIVHRYETKKR